MHLEHPVVLVVGAGGGLGTAIAEAFAARGARLVLAARRAETIDSGGAR